MSISSAMDLRLWSSRRPGFLPTSTPSASSLRRLPRSTFLPSTAVNHSLRSGEKKLNNKTKDQRLSLACNAQLLADLAPATSAAYGTLLLGGGLLAYARSGSKESILGGLSGAALMAGAYYLMQSPETEQIGEALGFGSAFVFAAVFGIRLASTKKLMPSGLLLALSSGALAVFLSAYMHGKMAPAVKHPPEILKPVEKSQVKSEEKKPEVKSEAKPEVNSEEKQ